MPAFDKKKVGEYLMVGQNANSTKESGKALEDLVCYIFGLIPGITITHRDQFNTFKSEEIDVALWNDKYPDGIPFLQNLILVECKNWSKPVGSSEVSWFDQKIRIRGLEYGLLIAAKGITGNSRELSNAHQIVAAALSERRRLIVITSEEILCLNDTDALVHLIKEKLCKLAVIGSIA